MIDHQIELEVKTIKAPETDEEKQALESKKSIKGEFDLSDFDIVYRRVTMNLNDILSRVDFDDEHTMIYTNYGMFLVNIPYDTFSLWYEVISGKKAVKISDFKFVREQNKKEIKSKFKDNKSHEEDY